jgi:hypothetical protein
MNSILPPRDTKRRHMADSDAIARDGADAPTTTLVITRRDPSGYEVRRRHAPHGHQRHGTPRKHTTPCWLHKTRHGALLQVDWTQDGDPGQPPREQSNADHKMDFRVIADTLAEALAHAQHFSQLWEFICGRRSAAPPAAGETTTNAAPSENEHDLADFFARQPPPRSIRITRAGPTHNHVRHGPAEAHAARQRPMRHMPNTLSLRLPVPPAGRRRHRP